MACPHVSGMAALCYASGLCKSDVTTELSKLMIPAWSYSQFVDTYRFSSDPLTNSDPGKYYGYMVWGRRFWGRDSSSNWFPDGMVQQTRHMASDGTLDDIDTYS